MLLALASRILEENRMLSLTCGRVSTSSCDWGTSKCFAQVACLLYPWKYVKYAITNNIDRKTSLGSRHLWRVYLDRNLFIFGDDDNQLHTRVPSLRFDVKVQKSRYSHPMQLVHALKASVS